MQSEVSVCGQQTIRHYMHASDHEAGGKADADAEETGSKDDALETQSNYSQL